MQSSWHGDRDLERGRCLQTPTTRRWSACDRSERRNRRCGAVRGCGVLWGTSGLGRQFVVTRKTATPNCARMRVARTTITSSELLSRSVCAVACGGASALEPAARAPSSEVDWARQDAGDRPSSPPVEQCAVSEASRCVRQVHLTYQRPHGRGPRRGGHKEAVLQTDAQFGRTIDDGQIFAKNRRHEQAMLVAAWCIIEFSLLAGVCRSSGEKTEVFSI